jgi:peptidoglycan hydrolase-like protein with peptidoglycan-binding domain
LKSAGINMQRIAILIVLIGLSASSASALSVDDEDCRAKVYSTNVVTVVQEALKKAGLLGSPPDGRVNPQTKAAIRAFRKQKGLPDSDRIDPEFLRALLGESVAPVTMRELQDLCEAPAQP